MRSKALGVAMIAVLAGIIAVSVAAGLISAHFWGPDNAVEEGAEELIDETIEEALDLPDDSIHIDLSPEK